ncbi:MAG: hypothetical protein OEN23_04815 [Paracoccaceae bacterium]|nr:hypothetical protein [Paracoccaceae bacterium]
MISAPIERPARITGGAQAASIISAQSRAKSAIDQGAGSEVVSPTPRGSYDVERNRPAKCVICSRQASAGESPPGTQTMSGPCPTCATRIRAPLVSTEKTRTDGSKLPKAAMVQPVPVRP